MKKTIGAMAMVGSFVFILFTVGGIQNDTIGFVKALMSIFGGFSGLLVGFIFFCDGAV